MFKIHSHRLQSIFWMFLWAFFFSIAMSLVKCLEDTPTSVVVFARFGMACVISLPLLLRQGNIISPRHALKLYALNAFLVCLALGATYYAYSKLHMGIAASVGYTAPMITITLALFILRERVHWTKWMAVIIGYGGVLVLMHPEHFEANIAIGIAFFANVCTGLGKIVAKKLTFETDALHIVFYTNLFCLALSSVFLSVSWHTPPVADLPFLAGLALCGALSQFCSYKALEVGMVTTVAPFEYLKILFMIPIGFLFFHEVPTSLAVVGISLIILTSLYLTWLEMRQEREEEPSSC
jgi:drug/metabolite transporter (DMT)-like permease